MTDLEWIFLGIALTSGIVSMITYAVRKKGL